MKLGVNIDHVATLRQARKGQEPDPLRAAQICQKAGAHGIVMHLREDRRHIQDLDLFRVREKVSIKLNLEMCTDPSIVKIASKLLPDQVTLVPEKRQEMTTESGLDLFKNRKNLKTCIDKMNQKNITVSLFIEPSPRQLEEAKRLGVNAVEFHTGLYAHEKLTRRTAVEFEKITKCSFLASQMGIVVHAGHGLDYTNVVPLKKIPQLEELNIGYSIISRALWVGLENAVKEMLLVIR